MVLVMTMKQYIHLFNFTATSSSRCGAKSITIIIS